MTAMMRRDQHVTLRRACREKPAESRPLEVTSEQQATASSFDSQHNARLIIGCRGQGRMVLHRCGHGHRGCSHRMKHPCHTGWPDADRIAPPHNMLLHTGLREGRQQPARHRGITFQEFLRDNNLANPESLEKCGHGIEVICICMGEHKAVDHPDSLGGKHSRQ